jgi:hypothetical protein
MTEAGRIEMSVETILKQTILEPGKSRDVLEFEERLRETIIGQDEAVAQLVNVMQSGCQRIPSNNRRTAWMSAESRVL